MHRLPYVAGMLLGFVLAVAVHAKYRADLAAALENYRMESSDSAHGVAAAVQNTFDQMYGGLRTMARLPGVRSIDRYGEHFDENARLATQEIYNNLAANVAMSEVYIVPLDLDPDVIDPVTGKPGAPITTFDELIVGRHGGPEAETSEHGEEEKPELEEIEIYEYRLMKQQLAILRARYPTEDSIAGLAYPAVSGPEVVTCDNRRYDPSHPDDLDRAGLVYAVPFYGPDGHLRGSIAGVILSHALRDLLPDGGYALLDTRHGYVAGAHQHGPWRSAATAVAEARPDPDLLYSEVIPIAIPDQDGGWVLWTGQPDDRFWQRGDVRTAERAALTGYTLAALVTLLLSFAARVSRQRTLFLTRQNAVLEERVRGRTAELERARDAAEAGDRAKSQFVANMSHEIRTPLNGVLGMLDLLSATPLSSDQREHLETARSSADVLLHVIDEILDFSKLEAGRLEVEAIPFDLRQVVHEAVSLLAQPAHTKHLELIYLVDADLPETVRGDPTRLRQVLLNLVGNAIKFTARGEVSVRVERELDGTGLRFEIRDTGIGISSETLARLFRAFTQADGSTTRRYGGTGLGLAICKRLVDAMGGTLQVESREGEGSTFSFTLPLRDAHAGGAAPQRSRRLCGIKALVVDDNAANRTILEHHLHAWGIALVSVAGARAALGELERAVGCERPFDVALLDFHMPEIDGLDLARSIESDPRLRSVRRILLSSAQAMTPAELAGTGIERSLCKPIRPSHLYDAIAGVVRVAPPPNEQVKAGAQPDTAGARVLLVEDNLINQIVALAMLKRLGIAAVVAGNGREALDITAKATFDLVLMDCQLPEMDGFDATRAIRERERQLGVRRTPIVAMTANAMEGDRERCFVAGMDGYLAKPVDAESLRKTVTSWLEQREASAQPPS